MLVTLFWSCFFLVAYTYVGYGIALFVVTKFALGKKIITDDQHFPTVSFIVPCFNEEDFIEEKIKNCLALSYPSHLIEFIFISDGSSDTTPLVIAKYISIKHLHEDERRGKAMAMNRAVGNASNEILIFSDSNTHLPSNAVELLVRHYANPEVGGVSGEKRVHSEEVDQASSAGEGLYWKYESYLKKKDYELHSIVGAAGELFSVRKSLFEHLSPDTILDDFMLSLKVAHSGYRIAYEPESYAYETASASVKEELKRKIRIAAGGWQSMVRLWKLLIPFKNPVLTFQYISHRVLRWSITPLALLLLLILNLFFVVNRIGFIYDVLMLAQIGFYILAALGAVLGDKKIGIKGFFVPYYFFIMNYAVYIGFYRYLFGKQSAKWERAKRAKLK